MTSIFPNSSQNSDKIAIILCNGYQILTSKSYKDIFEISEKIGKILKNILQNSNTCLGLLMEKNVYLPSIIVSLQKMKCAFTFFPENKLHRSTQNYKVEWILSLEEIEFHIYEKVCQIELEKNTTLFLWRNISIQKSIESFNNIFCIAETSGTTGENKTIRIPYSCIASNAISLGKIFNINSNDVIFWGTPLSFDPSLIELLLALQNGATFVIVTYSTYFNPQVLYNALFNVVHATFLQMVPSVFLRWNENILEKILCHSTLKTLALGGEPFPRSLLRYSRQDKLRLFNLYGITELSCWATIHEIKNETSDDEIPLGKCLDETSIKVYEENFTEIKEGVGELYVGSDTRQCYINNEVEDSDITKFRETGDLVLVHDENIYFKGRKNRIIKRFGHKVNLTKIEETIFDQCGIISKCVWSHEHNKILTFILIKENYDLSVKEKILDKLRNKLLHLLPESSFPDYFEILQNFPITSHGKVDEKKLETFYMLKLCNTEYDVTNIFITLWCKYLGIDTKLEYFENYTFFEMGGNSITVLQLIEEFKQLTNVELSDELVTVIFDKKFKDCMKLVEKFSQNPSVLKRQQDDDVQSLVKRLKFEKHPVKVLWKYDLKACVDGSPLIFLTGNNFRIAAGSFCNIFVVLDQNGQEIYKDVLNGSIESTPALSPCKNYLYIGCFDGTMYCIDFNRNKRIWEYKAGDRIKSSPIFCKDNDSIIFGSYDKYIYSLSSTDGSLLWKTELDGSISSNLISDDIHGIYAATTHGTCYCIYKNGTIKWKFNCGSPIFGTPFIISKYQQLLVPSVVGVIFCISIQSGKMIWKFRSDGNIFSSIITFKDTVIYGCHDKNIYFLKIFPNGCDSVKKVLVDGEISSTPCVFEKEDIVICICNNGNIYYIDYKTLSVLRKASLPGEVFSSPLIYNNNIYVGCRDNYLYCLLPE